MAAHPIGKGTANVAVNLLDAEKSILGRLALAEDRSLGDFIRRTVVIGLRATYPAAASEMEAARRNHNEQMIFALR